MKGKLHKMTVYSSIAPRLKSVKRVEIPKSQVRSQQAKCAQEHKHKVTLIPCYNCLCRQVPKSAVDAEELEPVSSTSAKEYQKQ